MKVNIKWSGTLLLLLLIPLSYLSLAFSPNEPNDLPPRWEKLGQRKVNYGLDRDEIYVTRLEGRFKSLRLHVERSGVNVHRVVVHFGNGSTKQFRINRSMPAGSISPNMDLPGNKRVIKKVVFYYDTKNFAGKKARVELWGRH